METSLFAPWGELLSGLVTGIFFGFLLRKAYVTRFNVIVGQLLLKDFTVMNVMMTAVAVGGVGIYSLIYLIPTLELTISATTLFSALVGGAIFGIGMAIMGYCPGTGVAAIADGAKDMWFGLLGMVVGAGIYAEVFPWIQKTIKPPNDITTTTLPEYFEVSPWVFIVPLLVMVAILAAVQMRSDKTIEIRD
jgi:uncharacterized membrane protein YedE/YeeE